MPEKKKKIIIGASIAGIVLLLVILIVAISNNNNTKENTETLENVDLSELVNVEDIESSPYKTEETKEEISSKYHTGKETYEVKVNVQAGETEGKMIYVRGNYDKLNIYKTEYTLNKYEDKTTKVRNILKELGTTKAKILGVNTKTTKERIAIMDITLEVENLNELNKAQKAIRKVDSVYEVKRKGKVDNILN